MTIRYKKAGELMQDAWHAYKPISKISRKQNLPREKALTGVYEALCFAIEKFADEVQLSWHKDTRKRGWNNETAEIIVSYGAHIHIPLPLSFVESKGILEKVKNLMSKTIELANGISVTIQELDPDTLIKIEFDPKPGRDFHNTEHSFDIGSETRELAPGILFYHWWNHSNVPQTFEDEETGEQYQEWADLEKDEYKILITDPLVIGVDEAVFEPKTRAEFRLARLVREKTGRKMNNLWKIHVVDQFPDVKPASHSTPANTSSYSRDVDQVTESIMLVRESGWTGSRNDYGRELYVLHSFWNELSDIEPEPETEVIEPWQLAKDGKMTARQWVDLFGPITVGEFDQEDWTYRPTVEKALTEYEYQQFMALRWEWAAEHVKHLLDDSVANPKYGRSKKDSLLLADRPSWVHDIRTGEPAGPPQGRSLLLECDGYNIYRLHESKTVFVQVLVE